MHRNPVWCAAIAAFTVHRTTSRPQPGICSPLPGVSGRDTSRWRNDEPIGDGMSGVGELSWVVLRYCGVCFPTRLRNRASHVTKNFSGHVGIHTPTSSTFFPFCLLFCDPFCPCGSEGNSDPPDRPIVAGVSEFALPDPNNPPTQRSQLSGDRAVALDISSDLGLPKSDSRFRDTTMDWTAVPKASVNKNGHFAGREN